MYKTFVRSHFDYCDIIYHIPPICHQPPLGLTLNHLMEKVEKVQYQAALAITGAWQGSSRSKLYEELGWESLSDRRNIRRTLQIEKIINNNSIEYLRNELPSLHRELFSGRHRNTFHEIKCNSKRYKESFFPDAISSWNNCMRVFNYENIPTKQKLKSDTTSLYRPIPRSIFGIYDPSGIRHIFLLRLNLSPLKDHKWRHNFADTCSNKCLCNEGKEDTTHYLLLCSSFNTQRGTLTTSVKEILSKYNLESEWNKAETYLYGNHIISREDNKNIILQTIRYIKDTNRFSTPN